MYLDIFVAQHNICSLLKNVWSFTPWRYCTSPDCNQRHMELRILTRPWLGYQASRGHILLTDNSKCAFKDNKMHPTWGASLKLRQEEKKEKMTKHTMLYWGHFGMQTWICREMRGRHLVVQLHTIHHKPTGNPHTNSCQRSILLVEIRCLL